MQIEYDNDKRVINLAKHGLEFSLFPDVFASQIYRERDPYRKEVRWRLFGYILGQMVCAVYSIRHKQPYAKNHRVVSIREVGSDERKSTLRKAERKRQREKLKKSAGRAK